MSGEAAMELEKKTLESIGNYVKKNLGTWLAEAEYGPPGCVLLERLIRLEEELKAQRQIMEARFDAVDKRIEDLIHYMDKRFEAVDKRFSNIQWVMGLGFTLMAGLMAVFNFF